MMTALRPMLATFILLTSAAGAAHAEIKTVQMKIAGYLCGN